LFGGSGNYASALYIASVKANAIEKVESEILQFVEAIKGSSKFSQFIKDLSVKKDVRVKVIEEICGEAKFSDVTKNFLGKISLQYSSWYGSCEFPSDFRALILKEVIVFSLLFFYISILDILCECKLIFLYYYYISNHSHFTVAAISAYC